MPELVKPVEETVRATIPCTDPATGERLGEMPALTTDEVRERIVRARRAQQSWKTTPFSERRRVLRHMLEYILEHADELCEHICRDSGKTLHNAMVGEIWPIAEKLRWTIAHGEKHLKPERVSSGLLKHKRAAIEFHPLGVIGVIAPWNFPLQNILGPVIPALFAGNAVLVKVSEWTSWSAKPFQEAIDRILRDCGYPTDLVQILTGYGDTGAALITEGSDKIIFTGSMANGRRVIEESAESLTPVILELGGKDPMIVCDDADIHQAAHAAVSGSFISSGQMCLAAERVMVFESVHDEFIKKVVDIALRLRQGAPLSGKLVDVGAMTMPAQVDIVDGLVKDAVKNGAKVLAGGKRGRGGQFYQPTVLSGVTPQMRIMNEETFGPVLAICKVKGEEEALKIANDSPYGLSSSVFTKDAKRGRRFADQLVAGSTCVNDFAVMYMNNDLPFGGVRGSGYGRLNGREGLRECTNIKAVVQDRLPIHKALEMFPSERGDYEMARSAIRMIYRRGALNRIGNAIELGRRLIKKN